MTAYYNENNKFCAAWLRNLIASGLIAYGDVDDRPIQEVRPSDLSGYTQCHFFAGIGVWSYALREANWPDERPIWTGSCPCQPFSVAGSRKTFGDDRDLWPIWRELVYSHKPAVVIGEQVAGKSGLVWLDLLYSDMEAANYSLAAANLSAGGFGAPHKRQRLFWAAYSKWNEQRREEPRSRPPRRVGRFEQSLPWDGGWEAAFTKFRVLDDGIARSVATTDAYRNAIVAPVAAEFCAVVKELADA